MEEFLLPDDVIADLSTPLTEADWKAVQCIFAEGGFFKDPHTNFRPFSRMKKKLLRGRWVYSVYIPVGRLLDNINVGRSHLGLPDIPSFHLKADWDTRAFRIEFDSDGTVYHHIKAVRDWARGLFADFPCYFEEFLRNGSL